MQALRVLVVEDESIVALEIEDRLQKFGYSVCGVVPSGEEAVKKALELSPDLILMDIHLAGTMDGIEAAEEIRKHREIPIVFLTAYADRATVDRAKKAAPFGYIVKPFDEQVLGTTIELAMFKHELTRKLEASQRWLSAVLRSIGDGVIAIDENERITFINPVAERLTGWSQEEALGKELGTVFNAVVLGSDVGSPERAHAAQGDTSNQIYMLTARNGDQIPIERTVSPITDENDRRIGAVLVFRDVTKRIEAEEAIRRERDRAQQYLDIAAVLMVALNEKGEITLINRKGCEILGYEEHELIGKNWFETVMPDQYRDQVEEKFNKLMAGVADSVKCLECEILTRTKEHRIIGCHATPIRASDGRITGVLVAAQDLTEQRRAEKEKEQLQAQLFHSQKMEAIGTLAAGVAHDFNNLLTAIQGNAELALFRLEEGNPVRGDIDQIKKAAERAASLTKQLLVFSRKQPMQFGEVDLNQTVNNMIGMLKRLIGENIKIRTELEPDLAPIQADSGGIEQVILNLAVNARDAMPDGGTLTIRTESLVPSAIQRPDGSEPPTYVRLIIEDTGIGMDKNALEHAFEPFFSTKEVGRGTGLGLSVVYGIVKQHGGDVRIESSPGEGTRVTVTLPATPGVSTVELAEPAPLHEIRGHGERLLLVEDDEDVAAFLERVFTEQGYQVDQAHSKGEALTLLAKKPSFDAVLCDVVLPDGSGFDLVDEISKKAPNTALILSSGYIDERARCSEAYSKGIPFLRKPYSVSELLSEVRKAIDSKTRMREPLETT